MAKRNRMDVDTFFSEVDQTQEVYDLRERIQALEAELDGKVVQEQYLIAQVEQLRSQSHEDDPLQNQQLQNQLEALRQHLKESQGVAQYPIGDIFPNPDQPRKTFTEEVESMALSLKQEGQLDPIILFEDGMIFDGECRWRAAQTLGWDKIDAIFTSHLNDPYVLRRKAYVTSLHRHGLNALDKAETLLAIVCDQIPDISPETIPRTINRVLTRLKRKKQSFSDRLHLQLPEEQKQYLETLDDLNPLETQILLIFLGLQENIASLNRNIFPTLKLAPELKQAVRERALGCAQAVILNQLSAASLGISEKQSTKLRLKGIQAVLDNNLSTVQTRKWVSQQKKKDNEELKLKSSQEISQLLVRFQKLNLIEMEPTHEELEVLQTVLQEKLEQVRQLLR
jgi:ParB family transcriptional regulator, chromosome partitioning protein